MLQRDNKCNYSCGTCDTSGDEHKAVATFPVELISGYDDEAKKHGYQTAEESGLHRRDVADLFDTYIHHGEEECSSQHVQDTFVELKIEGHCKN